MYFWLDPKVPKSQGSEMLRVRLIPPLQISEGPCSGDANNDESSGTLI
jgi:hypothetical protein